ncbi:MAG: nitronate monooxygenase [Dehalococcoidia bacterium]|nr:MAG: nitronate monooxygenase [Dehalococcoidia bacterium]
MARRKLHTKLCDLLGIEYPIIQAGMGGFSDPPLVIAVSEAGGLGTLGGATYTPETLDAAIREIRKGTSKPFGIDLLLPESLQDYAGFSKQKLYEAIPQEYRDYEKELRRKFAVPQDYVTQREVALWTLEGTKAMIEVCLENSVPVLAAGLGRLGWTMTECRARGIKTIGIGANVKMAMKHVEDQVDVIVAQGYDAGGHTGTIGTLALVPQIVDAVKPTPVAAAGGIADGRGLVAALALGAEGVWCGSMFLLTPDVTFTEGQKDRIIAATERDAVITKGYTGKTARQLRNPMTESWDKGPLPPLGWPLHLLLTEHIIDYAFEHRDESEYDQILITPVSQATRLLNRRKPVKDIIDDVIEEAVRILDEGVPLKGSGDHVTRR